MPYTTQHIIMGYHMGTMPCKFGGVGGGSEAGPGSGIFWSFVGFCGGSFKLEKDVVIAPQKQPAFTLLWKDAHLDPFGATEALTVIS